MSLDVYLTTLEPVQRQSSGIFIRKDGSIREITRDEWDERCPGHEPTIVERSQDTNEVYSSNITHNLGKMAEAAGIYKHVWRPEEIGITDAAQLIEPLKVGLATLKADPAKFQTLNPANGWGKYEGLVGFVEGYLDACEENPDAKVRVWA